VPPQLAEVSHDMGVVRVFGKGSKERVVPARRERSRGCRRYAKEGRPAILKKRASDYVIRHRRAGGR